jgi:hypothetical protein
MKILRTISLFTLIVSVSLFHIEGNSGEEPSQVASATIARSKGLWITNQTAAFVFDPQGGRAIGAASREGRMAAVALYSYGFCSI